MVHSIRRPMLASIVALIMGSLLVVPAMSGASESRSSNAPTGHASRAYTCAEATRIANFAERRVKKQRKLWRNGYISTAKYKNSLRIWKSWIRARNRICSQNGGGGTGGGGGGNPPPLALSESEVRARVNSQAYQYCFNSGDPYCYDYGVYTSGGSLSCESKSTYTWSCYGWNDEYDGTYYTCAFREVVSRSGYNALTSYRDSSYGSGGFSCS